MNNDSKEWFWWKHGVIYEIFPKSFYDSNADGTGDIQGIIQKLAYLSSLGVDAIWLTPIYESPMFDFGYDVSNYRKIDPVFGTLNDFKTLMLEANKLNIRIIMDMVLNHTSHLHPWFIESKSSLDNPKRDWYIWKEGVKNKPPNNWLSSWGGSAWEKDETTGHYYFHSCMKEQPDLNWRNKELIEAVFEEVRYWLDMGVDGFRLDVINWIIKDKHLRNNPSYSRLLNIQRHLFDRNRKGAHRIARKFRLMLDEYEDRMAVGEVFSFPPGNPKLSASYLGKGDELNLAFDFSLMYRTWNASSFYKCIKKWYKLVADKGWPSIVLSSHDYPRSIGRFAILNKRDRFKRAKVAAVLQLTLKGTPFIYYGEEIGMTNVYMKPSEISDPLGKKFWPIYKGRQPARAPMQWTAEKNGGFTTAADTWMKMNADYKKINVETQLNDDKSLLNLYKDLIEIRKNTPALYSGEFEAVKKGKTGVLAYYRLHYFSANVFVALNFTSSIKTIRVKNTDNWKILLSTHRKKEDTTTINELKLAPYEASVFVKV